MSKKNQHYVPQFHLRQWSDDGKLISLYNKKNNIFVHNKGPIKNLASKKYLYDENGALEDILSDVECQVAPIYKKIIENETLDGLSDSDCDLLFLHLVLCNERTIASGNLYEEEVKTRLYAILEIYQAHGKYTDIELSSLKDSIRVQHPCNEAILAAFKLYRCISDLNLVIIRNNSKTEFLSSDNPTIKYNLWSLKRNLISGWGLSSVGIMFILPISPKIALFAYDDVIYSAKALKNRIIDISQKEQIDEINKLMFLNANEIIFFSSKILMDYVEMLSNDLKKCSEKSKGTVVWGNTEQKFIMNFPQHTLYQADMRFLDILKESFQWPVPGTAEGLLRPRSEMLAALAKKEWEKMMSQIKRQTE